MNLEDIKTLKKFFTSIFNNKQKYFYPTPEKIYFFTSAGKKDIDYDFQDTIVSVVIYKNNTLSLLKELVPDIFNIESNYAFEVRLLGKVINDIIKDKPKVIKTVSSKDFSVRFNYDIFSAIKQRVEVIEENDSYIDLVIDPNTLHRTDVNFIDTTDKVNLDKKRQVYVYFPLVSGLNSVATTYVNKVKNHEGFTLRFYTTNHITFKLCVKYSDYDMSVMSYQPFVLFSQG